MQKEPGACRNGGAPGSFFAPRAEKYPRGQGPQGQMYKISSDQSWGRNWRTPFSMLSTMARLASL